MLLLSPPDVGVGRVSAVSTWSCCYDSSRRSKRHSWNASDFQIWRTQKQLEASKDPPKPAEAEPKRQGTVMEQGKDQGDCDVKSYDLKKVTPCTDRSQGALSCPRPRIPMSNKKARKDGKSNFFKVAEKHKDEEKV